MVRAFYVKSADNPAVSLSYDSLHLVTVVLHGPARYDFRHINVEKQFLQIVSLELKLNGIRQIGIIAAAASAAQRAPCLFLQILLSPLSIEESTFLNWIKNRMPVNVTARVSATGSAR